MKRVIVIGCPGSGKSTFSVALAKRTGLPLYHLDMMYWNADKTTVPREVFLGRLRSALAKDSWIIDGNYASTMQERMAMCDTVFFLDYPQDVCFEGVRARRGVARGDIPWVETEEDEEFIEYIRGFAEQQRPTVLELLKKHGDRQIFVFKSRSEADEFLGEGAR